jgi:hypothetical protein
VEGPAEVHGVAFGWLHDQQVLASRAQIDLGVRRGELARPPPTAQHLGIGPGAEDLLARRVD